MATRRENSFISSRGAFLWSTTFIMLSGVILAERQCYWCGPLAEQVHRSRRAPPCEIPTNHVTTCEPGLAYCAVVATSPPHVESRLCVKLYQDECYPLFCNSTRTWKMTCPCRDDLCNGNNTEREKEAFAVLAKLGAKSQNNRIKKREITLPTSTSSLRTIIITNITEPNQTNEEMNEINKDDQMIVVTSKSRLEQSKIDVSVNTNPPSLKLKEHSSTENPGTENSDIENSSTENPITSENDQQESSENPVIVVTTQTDNKVIISNVPDLGTTHLTTQNDNEEMNVGDLGTTDSVTEIASQKEAERTKPITTMAMKYDIKENLINKANIKPNEQLPTAEALQQNVSPSVTSTKTTESVKLETTDSFTHGQDTTTVEPDKGETKPTEGGGNFATRLSLNTRTLLSAIFVVVLLNLKI